MVETLKGAIDPSAGKTPSESDNGYREVTRSIFDKAKSENLSPEDVVREIWQRFLDPHKPISAEMRNKLITDYLDRLPESLVSKLTSDDLRGESIISRIVEEERSRARRMQQQVKPVFETKSQETKKEKRKRPPHGMAKHIRIVKSQGRL